VEGCEDLYDGEFGVAFVSRRGALYAQSRRRRGPRSALARVRAGDQVPLGEDHPHTRVSSLFIYHQRTGQQVADLSSTRLHTRLHYVTK